MKMKKMKKEKRVREKRREKPIVSWLGRRKKNQVIWIKGKKIKIIQVGKKISIQEKK